MKGKDGFLEEGTLRLVMSRTVSSHVVPVTKTPSYSTQDSSRTKSVLFMPDSSQLSASISESSHGLFLNVSSLLENTGWSAMDTTQPKRKTITSESAIQLFTDMFNINDRVESSILMYDIKTHQSLPSVMVHKEIYGDPRADLFEINANPSMVSLLQENAHLKAMRLALAINPELAFESSSSSDFLRISHSIDELVECGHYPTGFGFYLFEKYNFYTDPDSQLVLKAILSVPDLDTKDKLLCFLDDYIRRQYILKSHKHDRILLTLQVHDVLTHAMEKVNEAFFSFHSAFKPAVEASVEVHKMCEDILQGMFDMYSFHKVVAKKVEVGVEKAMSNMTFSHVSNKHPLVKSLEI
jgi:hypothetical protein